MKSIKRHCILCFGLRVFLGGVCKIMIVFKLIRIVRFRASCRSQFVGCTNTTLKCRTKQSFHLILDIFLSIRVPYLFTLHSYNINFSQINTSNSFWFIRVLILKNILALLLICFVYLHFTLCTRIDLLF